MVIDRGEEGKRASINIFNILLFLCYYYIIAVTAHGVRMECFEFVFSFFFRTKEFVVVGKRQREFDVIIIIILCWRPKKSHTL